MGKVSLVVAIFLVYCSLTVTIFASSHAKSATEEEAMAVVQAIEDEIYDYSYQGHFGDLGEFVGRNQHRLTVYIQPHFRDGHAWVIYKLMPYGEVYRMFRIRDDGLAVLHGNPENGFPPTQPDYLTVYMEDDELCRKKSQWLRYFFVIDTSPAPERIEQAINRQKKRYGFSAREYAGVEQED